VGLFAGILLHDSPSHVGKVHRSVGRLPCEPLSIIHKSHLAIGFSVITHCTFSSPQLARTKQRKLNSHVLNSTNSFQKMCLQYNMVCTVMWCSYSRSRCWKRHAQQHTRPRMRSLSRIILASMRPSKPFNKFKPLPRLPAPSVKTWTYLYRELLTMQDFIIVYDKSFPTFVLIRLEHSVPYLTGQACLRTRAFRIEASFTTSNMSTFLKKTLK